jgi:type I restriction enzyme S subunit
MRDVDNLTPLRDVVELIMGQAPPSKDTNFERQGMPFVKVGEFGPLRPVIREWTINPLRVARTSDVLLCVVGATCGKINLGADCAIGRSVAAIRPNPAVLDQFYLYYFMMTLVERLRSGSVGAAQTVISKEMVESVNILLPSLPEQQRIVALLDEAFAGLATAKANAERNIQNARAIIESHLQSVFSQRGEGWEENTMDLSELCELIVDCEHKTAPVQDEGIPSIRTPNIGKGKLLLDGVNRVSEDIYKAWSRRAEPKPGDLILAREAPAGNVAVIPDGARVCLGQRTVLIRPKADIFDPFFLAYRLLEPKMQEKLLGHSRGATVQHVNMKDIRALNVGPIPPLRTQQEISGAINLISAEGEHLTRLYERKLAALEELKKSLLHQAFNGEL